MKKICILLWTELKYDGRVQKEIRFFQSVGFEVHVLLAKFNNDTEKNYNFKLHFLKQKNERNVILNIYNKFLNCIEAFHLMNNIKPNIIHCNDLPTLYGGWLYKKKYNKTLLVYDAHELYPEMQRSKFRQRLWSVIEKQLISFPDKIILPEANRAKYFQKKYNLKHTYLIENFPERIELKSRDYFEKFELFNKTKRILYLGAVMPDRGLEEIIKAIKCIKNKAKLVILGQINNEVYADELKNLIEELNLNNMVFFLDPVPNNQVIHIINSVDIGLIFYKDNNLNNYYCASNKLYEFIMLGKKVITNNYPGLIQRVDKNIGICIEKVNSELISKSIESLIDNQDSNCTWNFDHIWDNQIDELKKIYEVSDA